MPSERKIEGILIPMPAAFKQDGAIDYKGTDAIVDFYLDAGVHERSHLGGSDALRSENRDQHH